MEFDKDQLKKVRVAVGLSQFELADKVEVSRYTVVKWENGKAVPTLAQINKAAEKLGVPATLFLTGLGENRLKIKPEQLAA